MTDEWYYAEGNRLRQGPLSPENLVALYRSERIGLDTLVWREGMPQWRPLAEVADELGITSAPGAPALQPPPLPPAPAIAATAPAAAPAVPRKELSGCAIAAIASFVAGTCLLFLIAMLAAIALPKYQEYVLRSQATSALAQMSANETAIAGFHSREGRCPVNSDAGFGTPESYAGNRLGALRIGRFDNGHCGMEGLLAVPGKPELDGKAIWLDYDEAAGSWRCSSEIEDRYLPSACRG